MNSAHEQIAVAMLLPMLLSGCSLRTKRASGQEFVLGIASLQREVKKGLHGNVVFTKRRFPGFKTNIAFSLQGNVKAHFYTAVMQIIQKDRFSVSKK